MENQVDALGFPCDKEVENTAHTHCGKRMKYTSTNRACWKGEMREESEGSMASFKRIDNSEKTVAIQEDRWSSPQAARWDGGLGIEKGFRVMYGRSAMSSRMFEASLFRVGAVLRPEGDK